MAVDVGRTRRLKFHIYKGKTFAFDIVWWLDEAKTVPAVITGAKAKIRASNTDGAVVLLDLAPTVASNRVVVRGTPAQTAALAASFGFLEVEASTATQTKTLIDGPVEIHPNVSG